MDDGTEGGIGAGIQKGEKRVERVDQRNTSEETE